ncbi:hypothetical protein PIB30_035699 [Stylosanthes scabra]|uniref:Uncharacterized protein n=1 Tax=Stylosanthes scabra TaxID=79078 RepID=A0ABU6WGM5_9FABA|nr:hypothetical protein [Stylosanthes scabra]
MILHLPLLNQRNERGNDSESYGQESLEGASLMLKKNLEVNKFEVELPPFSVVETGSLAPKPYFSSTTLPTGHLPPTPSCCQSYAATFLVWRGASRSRCRRHKRRAAAGPALALTHRVVLVAVLSDVVSFLVVSLLTSSPFTISTR